MSFEASEEEKRELEYATQFFDFTPDSYADTISFTATDIIDEELNVRLFWLWGTGTLKLIFYPIPLPGRPV